MEFEIDEEARTVKCFICGRVILDMDEGELNPCEHIKMIYSDCCGEIVHTSNDFEKEGEEISKKISDIDAGYDINDLLEECAKKNKLEVCNITTSGISCGPCSNTDYYLVDISELFKPKKSKKSKKSKK